MKCTKSFDRLAIGCTLSRNVPVSGANIIIDVVAHRRHHHHSCLPSSSSHKINELEKFFDTVSVDVVRVYVKSQFGCWYFRFPEATTIYVQRVSERALKSNSILERIMNMHESNVGNERMSERLHLWHACVYQYYRVWGEVPRIPIQSWMAGSWSKKAHNSSSIINEFIVRSTMTTTMKTKSTNQHFIFYLYAECVVSKCCVVGSEKSELNILVCLCVFFPSQ